MRKYKKDLDVSYSIGVYPTIELLTHHPDRVEHILINSNGNRNSGVKKIQDMCRTHHITTEIADGAIKKISDSDNCYAVGIFRKFKSPLTKGNHMLLVNPDDRGNLGTIMRSMCAFGVNNLAIIRPATDAYDPRVIRASMGAAFKLNIAYYGSFSDYQENFRENAIYPFMTHAATSLSDVKIGQPYTLVFGNEGAGLPPEYVQIGTPVRIPQSSEVDSLNLAISVGIALYHTSTA